MDDLTKFVVGLIIIIAGAVWLWGTAPKGTNKKYIIFFGASGVVAGIAAIIGYIFHIVEMGFIIIVGILFFFYFGVKAGLSYSRASKKKQGG